MYCRTTTYKTIILLSLGIKKNFVKPPQTLRQSMLTSKEIADSFLKLCEILHIIIMYMAAEILLTLTISVS